MSIRHMRDATRSSMALFGRFLAEDVVAPGVDPEWASKASSVLHALDELDIVGDEHTDRELLQLSLADGERWLLVAEEGRLEGTDYIAHVLAHCGVGGYPGPAWVEKLLQSIAAADDTNRNAIALGMPEYVGLWRAASEVAGGLDRLVTVMDRR